VGSALPTPMHVTQTWNLTRTFTQKIWHYRRRWAIAHPHQKSGCMPTISRGVESRESLRASQLSMPHPAAISVHQKPRYT